MEQRSGVQLQGEVVQRKGVIVAGRRLASVRLTSGGPRNAAASGTPKSKHGRSHTPPTCPMLAEKQHSCVREVGRFRNAIIAAGREAVLE